LDFSELQPAAAPQLAAELQQLSEAIQLALVERYWYRTAEEAQLRAKLRWLELPDATLPDAVRRCLRLLSSADEVVELQVSLQRERRLRRETARLAAARADGLTSLVQLRAVAACEDVRRGAAPASHDASLLGAVRAAGCAGGAAAVRQWLRTLTACAGAPSTAALLKPADSLVVGCATRSSAPPAPLRVDELPGVQRLNATEQALCARLRLAPLRFLMSKRILMRGAQRSDTRGELSLVRARQLLRLDVRKTKVIFELLLAQGDLRKSC